MSSIAFAFSRRSQAGEGRGQHHSEALLYKTGEEEWYGPGSEVLSFQCELPWKQAGGSCGYVVCFWPTTANTKNMQRDMR